MASVAWTAPADKSAAPADPSAGASTVSPSSVYNFIVKRNELHDFVCAYGDAAADDFTGPKKTCEAKKEKEEEPNVLDYARFS